MAGIITDPIADMLIRIKNANQRKHRTVSIPYSNLKVKIAEILKTEGYIVDFVFENENEITKKAIVITLKYVNAQRAISGVKRISKPSLRVYVDSDNIPKVLSGFGTAIISTSKGLTTDKHARKMNVGGEVVAYVW